MEIAKTYRIETGRLIIRCYEPSDVLLFVDALNANKAHLIPWMPWATDTPENLDFNVERIRMFRGKFDTGLDYVYGVFDKTNTQLLGSCGLHTRAGDGAREIGYWIGESHVNNGYATEVVAALTKVGFEIEQLLKVEIHCDPENSRSLKIPKKLGFQLNEDRINGNTVWVLWKEDYQDHLIHKTTLRALDFIGREIPL
ncbi:GNAT family N-acetyltransferase [Pedobacter metabolipauper]|uniref:RimJ/RimL family protein N-acetyltransferase n=1 Tax=Pedobacter metabolipauper TaxID=425513 RepID=A0A4R6SS95_9SPHI|nr:GNAT family protein [Pedobacter metabolipauper]TDQ07114.1 RimJ/RimL family protein N-acetyltransferase [Pedobacter metabolipauper]